VDASRTEVAVPAEHATETWNALAERVQAFTQAWESGPEPPDVAAFVGEKSPAIRRLFLIELVKVDLDYRWGRNADPRRVEDYLAAFPELAQDGPPCDLVYEEFHARKCAGQPVDPRDYLARFPAKAIELGRLLGLESERTSASLVSGPQLDALAAGQTIDDFDLLALLGKGAFARVFLARQRSMQRLVALKASADTGQEPQALAQLDHAHIVRVFDQRCVPDRGLRLLYMQYVPGGSLQAVLDRIRQTPEAARSGRTLLQVVDQALAERGEEPPLGSALRERIASWDWPATVCWIAARLAEALDHAHRRGVLHRDVKPANVLLTAEGAPKLADFNVSFGSKLEGANPAAFFGGSLFYMSPEQLEAFNPAHDRDAGDLDGRSDLYALCLVLWELLAGRRPFPDGGLDRQWGRMLAQMTERRRAGVDPADTAALPAVRPPGLDEVLLAGLAPDPARRPESGAALARDLELCLQPRARGLLHPPAGGWRSRVRRAALFALVLAAILPNAVGGVLNFIYNRSEIIAHLPGAESVFVNVQGAINAVAFSGGIVILIVLARPVLRALRGLDERAPPGADVVAAARRRCLVLGDLTAGVGVAEWLLAGLAYPVSLCAALGPQPLEFFLHFFVSLALCGLLAAIQPFFWVTFLSVRVLLPPLLRRQGVDAVALVGMERLKRRTGLYLLLSAAAPMLSVAAMAAMGSENRAALGVLSVVGLAGFGAAFALSRALQGDLDALAGTAGYSPSAEDSRTKSSP
jgi:serine/threonine protein kinase